MSGTEHPIPAMDELREHLREAARRDIAAAAPKRRRRRVTFGVVALLLGGAAAAGAADLISSGEPLKSPYTQQERYKPSGRPQIVLTAHDKPLPWSVAVYDSENGQKCALAGQLRGADLGRLRNGTFHRYEPNQTAVCGDPTRGAGVLSDLLTSPDRTIVFGRAAPGKTRVTAIVDGQPRTTSAGAGGAFIFVFKGKASASEFSAR
jgi:hypothetical protein